MLSCQDLGGESATRPLQAAKPVSLREFLSSLLEATLMKSEFEDADWYRATTLAERIAAARALGGTFQGAAANAEAAGWRLLRWRSQDPFAHTSIFARWLATEGLTEEEFLGLLGEQDESLCARFEDIPPWLKMLAHAFSDHPLPTRVPLPESLRKQVTAGFLNLVDPLLHYGIARFREQARELVQQQPDAPFSLATLEMVFLNELPQSLVTMLSRTLVLELNVARLEGPLDGVSPEDRFLSFVESLHRPEIRLGILHEYPVLARQLTIRIDQWIAFALEFLGRLCADWDVIRRTFSPDKEPGVLTHLRTEAGDRHRNGRSVVIGEFSSGLRLVYKPKCMAADVHFQQLVNWFNQRGNLPALPTLQVLDRGTHGWVEFVAAKSCRSGPALSRFYERQGAYLALLYVVAATDFHCENVIAAGENPVLVDLEAIFQPDPPEAQDEDEVERVIKASVLRVGLLPLRFGANGDSDGLDLTGLGGAAGQLTPFGVPEWLKAGTDEMHFVRKPMTTPAARNRPSLNGSDVTACDYVEEITAGFARAYRLILRHRDELLSSSGPLSWFSDDEVRVVLRGTRTYGLLLEESFHPDVLRDALDRDLLLNRLWVAAESHPYLAKVIAAELQDLQNGDIPMFTTSPSVRDLWTSSGQPIRDFFTEPAIAPVRRRVEHLSENDLELQLWFIRASLATSVEFRGATQTLTPRLAGSQRAIGRERLLAAASSLGDRLASLAVCSKQDTSWVGVALDGERRWAIAPLKLDLYGGLPGVTLFLAHLGALTEEQRYTALAQRACGTMLRCLKRHKSVIKSIGAFNGWGGMIYTLGHLGALWHETELLTEAEAVVATLPSLIDHDEQLDIMGGAAGCIGALLSFYDQLPAKRTLDAAVQCGEHLIARAQRTQYGIGWLIPGESRPLAGFAHGGAGIAWALLRLATATRGERFRKTALGAIADERSLFAPEAGNWRDLRAHVESRSSPSGDGDFFMTAWCAGAPGIGLARLFALEQLDDAATRGEIDTALKTTLQRGFGQNHSMCHGDLGNIELLVQAGHRLNDSQWRCEADGIAGMIAERVAGTAYVCGTPGGVATPGLMTGLAGIGYGLLRLAEPERVPSVLTLESPPSE